MTEERTEGGTTIFTVVVPEDSPFFAGHFPGKPVLPAIGQLAIVSALLARVTGRSRALLGVDGLRLTRQVLPGDRLEVRVETPSESDASSFEIRRGQDAVSRGIARVAAGPGP